ncbi:MAG: glycosyltransferase family 2 protein [Arachnia sp.]
MTPHSPSARVCAGVVTFNPDIGRLSENLTSISSQVDRVILVDNASTNWEAIDTLLRSFPSVHAIRNSENRGIAAALNQVGRQAISEKYEYALMLDQDSVTAPQMTQVLLNHVGPEIGIVSPQIVDRNRFPDRPPASALDHQTYDVKQAARKGIITSGALTSLRAFDDIGGFDESFFIDYVDYDYNKRLLGRGYTLRRTGDTFLFHECGELSPTLLWTPRRGQDSGWTFERFYSFGHSPTRCYYKARNRILYSKKHGFWDSTKHFEGYAQILPQVVLTLLFEQDRMAKLRAFSKGVVDGLRTRVSEGPDRPSSAEVVQ